MIQDERMGFDLADRNGKSNSSASLKETFLTYSLPFLLLTRFVHCLLLLIDICGNLFFCLLENDTFDYQLSFFFFNKIA